MKKGIVKFYLPNGKTKKYFIKSTLRRVMLAIERINFQKAYCKVVYGKDYNHNNELVNFENHGTYTDKKELSLAVRAFWE